LKHAIMYPNALLLPTMTVPSALACLRIAVEGIMPC